MTEKLPHNDAHDTEPVAAPPGVVQQLGYLTVYRVMNLDEHSGVMRRSEDGNRVTYTVNNLQYPDQGDFAFKNPDEAITRAFPNHLQNVHAVRVPEQDVVTPYPDDAPNLLYVRNGATAEAVRVPSDITDRHIDAVNSGEEGLQNLRAEIDRLFDT